MILLGIALLLGGVSMGIANQSPPDRSRKWAAFQGLAVALIGVAATYGAFAAGNPALRVGFAVLASAALLRLTLLPRQARRRLERGKQVG